MTPENRNNPAILGTGRRATFTDPVKACARRKSPTAAAERHGAVPPILLSCGSMPPGMDSTARLAAIIASSDDAIISKDLNGYITSWNASAERMFGYSAEEAIGRHITLIIPEERLAEETEVLTRVRAGLSIEHFETVRRRKDGTPIDISLTVSPVRDNDGTVIGASKIARDITEQRRLRETAEQASRMKDEFLAVLSH